MKVLRENYRQFEKTDRHLEKAEILSLPGGRDIPEEAPTEDLTAETVITLVPALRGMKTAGQAGAAMARAAAARYAAWQASKRVIVFTEKQVARKYMRHAAQIGIMKNYNKANAELFKQVVINHVKNPTTQAIKGTHRKTIEVIHYFNPKTNLNVMTYRNGDFHSAWKLSPKQVNSLYKTRNIR